MTLKTDLDKLAASIAQKAATAATSLQEQIDALKALTGYYAVQQKGKKKSDDEDPDTQTFGDFSRQITGEEEPHGGKTRVRGRSGHA